MSLLTEPVTVTTASAGQSSVMAAGLKKNRVFTAIGSQRTKYATIAILITLITGITGKTNLTMKHSEAATRREFTRIARLIQGSFPRDGLTINHNQTVSLSPIDWQKSAEYHHVNPFEFATKRELQNGILVDNAGYPSAFGGQNRFVCKKNAPCYKIDIVTGKKTYYICHRWGCDPLPFP